MTRYALVSGSQWLAGGFESATDAMLFGASYFPHHPLTFHPEAPTMGTDSLMFWRERVAQSSACCGYNKGDTDRCPSCHENTGWERVCPGCEGVYEAHEELDHALSCRPLRALAGGGA